MPILDIVEQSYQYNIYLLLKDTFNLVRNTGSLNPLSSYVGPLLFIFVLHE